MSARAQALTTSQVLLDRAYRRLAMRVGALEAELEDSPAMWPAYIDAVRALAAVVPLLSTIAATEMLTTRQMADRLGIKPKALLRHKKSGAIRPAVQIGKLIRWRADGVAK